MAQQGYIGNPQSPVEELAIFVTYFFNDSKQTYGYRRALKVLERNSVAPSPEGRCAGSCSLEGLVACQPRPTVPAADPARRLDLIERDFTADAPARKLVDDITYIHTREGFVYPAGRDGAAYSKRIVDYAIAGTHANRIGPKNSGNGGSKLPAHQGCDDSPIQVQGTQSARPLTTPPP